MIIASGSLFHCIEFELIMYHLEIRIDTDFIIGVKG